MGAEEQVDQIVWLRQQALNEALPVMERARMVAAASRLAAAAMAEVLLLDEEE